jgi:lysophospholipase L1-like esterase
MGKALFRFKKILLFLQAGWSLLGMTLVVLLLTEALLRMSFAVRDRLGAPSSPDPRVVRDGYGGAPWAVEHYREIEQLEERWEPYVYFRPKAFRGRTITIGPDGLRSTWQPPPQRGGAHRAATKLLVLGGSSLWGFGARDDETIPSRLGRTLHGRGWPVEIKNLAELGYVSTQELIALVRELQAGYRPDVVLFYDGVNDTTSALLEGEAGLTTNEIHRRREFNLLQSPARLSLALAAKLVSDSASYRFARAVRARLGGVRQTSLPDRAGEAIPPLADRVVSRYEANLELIKSLGQAYGFRSLFFWQPDVFTKEAPVALEREHAARHAWAEPMFRAVHERIHASARLRADPAFHDLSAIFADSDGLIFIDYCHTTEPADERIAAAMADRVIEALGGPLPAGNQPGARGGSPRLERLE